MAVCGLPSANRKHATVMARFACDCVHAVETLTAVMAEDLGADTANLRLRIGLHSGDVTAGVLRGKKARFQL